MSLQFPNRADWLNIRRQVRVRDTRKLVHQSMFFEWALNKDGITRTLVKVKAVTFDDARNAQRRVCRKVPALRERMLAERRARQVKYG
jgi:hypothetical protein